MRIRPTTLVLLSVAMLLAVMPVQAGAEDGAHDGAWLRGVVRDAVTGAPVAGAEVGIFVVTPGIGPQPALGEASFRISAADGSFAYRGGQPEALTHFGVSDPPSAPLEGYEVLWRHANLEGGPPYEVDLELTPITGTPLVAGTVVDADTGEPVPYRYQPGDIVDPRVPHIFLHFDEPDDSPVDFLPFTRGWREEVASDFFFHGIEQGRGFRLEVVVNGYQPATFSGLVADLEQTGAMQLPLTRIGRDVPDDSPHAQGVEWVLVEGLATGFADGSFGPDQPVTRAQMATYLARALALEPGEQTFADVPEDFVHAEAISAVAQAGITEGIAPDIFAPALPVRRDQMATFLTRALELEPGEATFVDVEAGSIHAGAIAAVADLEITVGFDDGTFRPSQPVTRAQMATFLFRSLAD